MKYFFHALFLCVISLCGRAQDIVVNSAFGSNGVLVKSPAQNDNVFDERATTVIELPDKKLLLAVQVNNRAMLIRHLPDGSLDKTYGENGFSEPVGAYQPYAVHRQDGKVMIIGVGSSGSELRFVVALYDEAGKLDAGFGNQGIQYVPFPYNGIEFKKAVLQEDGKVLLTGSASLSNSSIAFVMRLTADAELDASFADAGFLTVNVSGITRVADLILNGSNILVGTTIYNSSERDFAVLQYLGNGSPDPSFSQDGLVKVNINAGDDLKGLVLQKDGKIIAAGSTGELTYSSTSFIVARLLPSGELDASFNQTGIAAVDFGNYNYHLLSNVVIGENGNINLSGSIQGSQVGLAFTSLTGTGSLNTTYGDNGKKLISAGLGYLNVSTGILTNAGSFVGAGQYWFSTDNNFAFDYLLVQLNKDGQPEGQFGNNGLKTGYVPGKYSSLALPKLFSNGDLLVSYSANGTNYTQGLLRLRPDGTEQADFGEQGLLKTRAYAYDLLPDGRIVTLEQGNDPISNTFGIIMGRYSNEGKPDLSFGRNGRKLLSFPGFITFNGFIVEPEGKLLLTSTFQNSNGRQQGFLTRLDADGNIDGQFGTSGKALFDADRNEYPLEPTIQPDGKILVKGLFFSSEGNRTQSFIRRFFSDGKPDENFGSDGIVTIGTYTSFINRLLIQSSGKLVVSAVLSPDNQQYENRLLRYNNNGTPDSIFGAAGKTKYSNVAAALLDNDKILVGDNLTTDGVDNVTFTVLDADGTVDKSFGTNGTERFELGSAKISTFDLFLQNNNIFINGVKNAGLNREGLLANFRVLYAPPSDTTITSFTLVNAASNKDIQVLRDGNVLDLTKLPRASLNVRANTTPASVGSVVLELKGARNYKHTENGAPFSLFGDNKGDYFGSPLPEGHYTLTATPYSKNNGKGTKGTPVIIRFNVVYPASVTRFVLTDAKTGKNIREIQHGSLINLAMLPSTGFSIRAITSPDTVGSVFFDLKGQQSHQQIENLLPYALFGGDTNQDNPWVAQPGSYTLTATPFSGPRKSGTKGKENTIEFKVIQAQNACDLPSFAPVISKRTSGGGYQNCIADFNNDGKPDMVTLEYYAFAAGVLLGNGDGSFKEVTPCGTGGRYPQAITTGDFNGDGNADLAIANQNDNDFTSSGIVSILLGKGDGSFAEPIVHVTGLANPIILAADFNSDGKVDLALTDNVPGSVGILHGKGDGNFGELAVYSFGGYFPKSMVIGDFNHDGTKDLAVASYNTIGVIYGKSDGTFTEAVTYPSGSSNPISLATADLNSDTYQDLMFTDYLSGNLGVLFGKGNGSFGEVVQYSIADGIGMTSVAADDLNGDQIPDLAIGNVNTGTLSLMLGNGDASFAVPVKYPADYRHGITVADFNGDGKKDLAFSSLVYGVGVMLNNCGALVPPALTRADLKTSQTENEPAKTYLTVFPNPSFSQSSVRFSVPVSGNVSLSMYDSRGLEIKQLFRGNAEKGLEYNVSLDGKRLPAGTYLLRLVATNTATSLKMLIVH